MTPRDKTNQPGVCTALLVAILMLLAVAVMVSGCSPTKYVPVETVRTEYVHADTTGLYERLRSYFESIYRRETSTDSVIDRTKETVVLKENGDTARHDKERIVYVASHREKELEHKVQQQDSTIKSLRLQLESVKRELTKWEQTKMDFGGFALGGLVIGLSIVVLWLIKKFRK